MNAQTMFAVLAALTTGTAIALQATLNGRLGAAIGPVHAGFLINSVGGGMAILAVVTWLVIRSIGGASLGTSSVMRAALPLPTILALAAGAGLLGILVVVGVSFAVKTVGVTAGLAAVILAQLAIGLLLDRIGAVGDVATAIDVRRVLGILAMAVGVWLLLPRSG